MRFFTSIGGGDMKRIRIGRRILHRDMFDLPYFIAEIGVNHEGDMEKAIDVLRKKGQKVAAKRADRDATEGAVLAKVNEAGNNGVLVSHPNKQNIYKKLASISPEIQKAFNIDEIIECGFIIASYYMVILTHFFGLSIIQQTYFCI